MYRRLVRYERGAQHLFSDKVRYLDGLIGFIAAKDLLVIACEKDHVICDWVRAFHAGRPYRHARNGKSDRSRLLSE